MRETFGLNLDFSKALPLNKHSKSPALRPLPGLSKPVPRPVFGFESPKTPHALSGPCALAVMLDHHGIGWSHLPVLSDGHPPCDVYMEQVMRWSETPDNPCPVLDTSPNMLLRALAKAGLEAHCYQGAGLAQADAIYLEVLKHELDQGRPVISLLCEPTHKKASDVVAKLAWRVVWKMGDNLVWAKSPQGRNVDQSWNLDVFVQQLQLPLAGVTHVAITTEKPQPILL
ncbi:MAG TPA: hypothetical protein VFV57_08945 [Limnobacter sp.]|nr:hypothetical protein [Limnobacter sp.]